jgi:hypothetical protein
MQFRILYLSILYLKRKHPYCNLQLISLTLYVFLKTMNAHAPKTFTKMLDYWLIQHTKQPQPPKSLDACSVVRVVELFSPLLLFSTRASVTESNNVCVVAVNNKVCDVTTLGL